MINSSPPSCFPPSSPPSYIPARSSRGSSTPGSYMPVTLTSPRAPRPGIIALPSIGPTCINSHIDGARGPSPIRLDMSLCPLLATATLGNAPCPAPLLAEPAIEPLIPSLVLSIDEFGFPTQWSQVIVRAEEAACPYVTIFDVLTCLFRSLRQPASGQDFMRLASDRSRDLVQDSYVKRYRAYHDRSLYDVEKSGGLKRVDWLVGRTQFAGLVPVQGPDVWKVQFL